MAKFTDPGELREWVELLAPVRTLDTYGDPVLTHTTWRKVWGSFRSQTARELVQSQQVQGQLTATIRIRAITGIDSGFQAICRDHLYELTGPPIEVREEGRLEYLDLPVIEVEHQ